MDTMINPGRMTRLVTIERLIEEVQPSGAVSQRWWPHCGLRAELVQQRAEDYLSGTGEGVTGRAVFRVWYRADITTGDRVKFNGETYQITGLVELGTRRGLDIQATCQGTQTQFTRNLHDGLIQ